MNAVCDVTLDSPEALCEWLNDGTAPGDLQLETKRPWAQTYRITGKPLARFLKVLPEVQTAALPALPLLSALFPDVVPTIQAVDPARGLVLLDHHGGVDLDRYPTVEQQQVILATYARLQAEAATHPELLRSLPAADLDHLVSRLLAFLDPEYSPDATIGPAGAKDFFGAERSQYYFELFTARARELSELIGLSKSLPLTINHCDLRAGNTARRANGDLVIYDWDEAVAGPAGMSLHNFFSGCATPCEMLRDPASGKLPERETASTLLDGYLATLVAHGYADIAQLERGLPGSICAGVIVFLLSYGRFAPPDESYAEDVGATLRKRLNDLLVLADMLQATSSGAALRIVADYEERERPDHACRVLAQYVERDPTDLAAAAKLEKLLLDPENCEAAPSICRRLLSAHPASGAVRKLCGVWNLEQLDFDAAIYQLTEAIRLGNSDDATGQVLRKATEYRDVCQRAECAGQIPTIRVSAEEQAGGQMHEVHRRLAVQLYREYGTLLIENAFPEQLVEQLHAEYLERYQRYFVQQDHQDALYLGSKRYMVTVDVAGAFNSPMVYANPNVAPIIREVLGGSMIMGGFVSVCSLPGADHMKVHKDHPSLFPDADDPDGFPSFAVTAIVPLRGFTQELGTTRVIKGSHRCSKDIAAEMESQDPFAPRGACLLMDYRLTHQGRGNRSDQVRPILTMIYHRPWFRDIANYGVQDPLLISDEAFAQVPEEHRPLFAWARPRGR